MFPKTIVIVIVTLTLTKLSECAVKLTWPASTCIISYTKILLMRDINKNKQMLILDI